MFVELKSEHEYLLWKMMTMKWRGKKNKEQGRRWNLVLCFFEWLVLSLLARILYRLSSVASRCVESRDWPSPLLKRWWTSTASWEPCFREMVLGHHFLREREAAEPD